MSVAIRRYLDKNAMTISKFSKQSAITPQTMINILKGRKMRRISALKICKASNGEITLSDLGFDK